MADEKAKNAADGRATEQPPAGLAAAAPKQTMKAKLERLASEYGPVALATYLVIFVVVLVGFATAIKLGMNVEGAAGNASVVGGAWLATKLTQPLRIGATLVLTPIIAKLKQRWQVRRP